VPSTKAPVRDERTEKWLRSRGVEFELRRVRLAHINERDSRRNQARAEAIDSEVVSQYAQAYKNGEELPPLVTYERGGQHVLVDGNHRHAGAKKAGEEEHDVYVLAADTPSEVVELLTAEANAKHGKPTTPEWRARQAVYLVAQGLPQETVAEALCLSQNQVSNAIRAARAEERAGRLGLNGFGGLPGTTKAALAAVKDDEVFVRLTQLIVATDWGAGAELNGFIRQVRDASSDAVADLLKAREDERAKVVRTARALKGRGRARITNRRTALLTSLGKLAAFSPEEIGKVFLMDEERKEVRKRIADAAIHLMELEEALLKEERRRGK
jgi:hypothetical protein